MVVGDGINPPYREPASWLYKSEVIKTVHDEDVDSFKDRR